MTYNPNIPAASDNLSTSQAQMLTNFGQLSTQFGIDHSAFNTGSGNGDGTHKKITFNAPPSPIPTPGGTVSNVYPNVVSAEQELHFKNASHATQITSGGLPIWKGGTIGDSGVVSATTGGNNSNGSMTLPNGVIFKWGRQFIVADNTTVSFPVAFPTSCFSLTIAEVVDDVFPRGVYIKPGFSRTGFILRLATGEQLTVNYFAIGN